MKKYFILVLISLISLAAAESVPNSLNVNLQVTDSSGNPTTGTYNFIFNLTNQPDCTSAFYTNSTSLTTDSRGIISYTLANINSNFDQKTYLCYYRDGVLKSNISVAQVPNAIRAKNVTVSGIIPDTNLNVSSYNITSNWFFGKLNWSNVQNSPSFLTQTAADLIYCKLTGCTLTGNLVVSQNMNVSGNLTLSNKICNSTACFTLSELNQSGSASETDPLAIHTDGSKNATSKVYFAGGLDTNWITSPDVTSQPSYCYSNDVGTNATCHALHSTEGECTADFENLCVWQYIAPANTDIYIVAGSSGRVNIGGGGLSMGESYLYQGIGDFGWREWYNDLIPEATFEIVDYVPGGFYFFSKNKFKIRTPTTFEILNESNETVYIHNTTSNFIQLTGSFNATGKICDSVGCISTLTETDPSWTGNLTSGINQNLNVTKNITIGSIGNPGCISIRDDNDAGWSHIQMRGGAIINGTGAC